MTAAAIETRALTRRFGDVVAVEDLDLEVRAGETFALLGPNGAGKTTTVRMLTCLLAPSSGGARVLGHDVQDDAATIRARVGLLTETPGLYDRLTAIQVLVFFARLYEIERPAARVREYLELLDLWDHRDRPTGGFSKGMKQKLALARAVFHDPDLLFMDEPTAGLDVATARQVRALLHRLRDEGRTILLTTHNLDEAERLADRIGVLDRRLLVADTPEALRRRFFARRCRIDLVPAGDFRLAAQSVDGVEVVESTPHVLRLDVDDQQRRVPDVIAALVSAGARVVGVGEESADLEEVYLRVVGNGADSAGGTGS